VGRPRRGSDVSWNFPSTTRRRFVVTRRADVHDRPGWAAQFAVRGARAPRKRASPSTCSRTVHVNRRRSDDPRVKIGRYPPSRSVGGSSREITCLFNRNRTGANPAPRNASRLRLVATPTTGDSLRSRDTQSEGNRTIDEETGESVSHEVGHFFERGKADRINVTNGEIVTETCPSSTPVGTSPPRISNIRCVPCGPSRFALGNTDPVDFRRPDAGDVGGQDASADKRLHAGQSPAQHKNNPSVERRAPSSKALGLPLQAFNACRISWADRHAGDSPNRSAIIDTTRFPLATRACHGVRRVSAGGGLFDVLHPLVALRHGAVAQQRQDVFLVRATSLKIE